MTRNELIELLDRSDRMLSDQQTELAPASELDELHRLIEMGGSHVNPQSLCTVHAGGRSFDVVAVIGDAHHRRIEYHKNAFLPPLRTY